MTIDDLIDQCAGELRAAHIEQPISEAELILCHLTQMSRSGLHLAARNQAEGDLVARAGQLVERRRGGEPAAYLFGYRDFYKNRFCVGPGVLIPRPETELVVEEALRVRSALGDSPRIYDLGAGSGCIGLSLLGEWPNAALVAVEKSAEARAYLEKNIGELGLAARTQVLAHGVEEIDCEVSAGVADLVVANPPYIGFADPNVEAAVRAFEPAEALFAEEEGLSAIRRWSRVAHTLLRPGGYYIFEMGAGQGRAARALLKNHFTDRDIRIVNDYSGLQRVVICRRS